MKVKTKRKEIINLIIAIIFLLALIIGAAYAFFKAQTGASRTFDIEATTGTTDNLTFSTIDEISLSVGADNLKNKGEDVSDASIAKARLIANNTTNHAERNYNVYLLIEENDIEYSGYTKGEEIKTFKTKEEKEKEDLTDYEGIPELIISIKKNGKEYEKEIKRLKKLENNTYDITEEEGLYAIAENEKIVSEGDITDEWEITVTYKNLNYNQQLNTGKKLTGKIIITTETLIKEIQTINDLVDLSKEVNDGDTKEGKYYVLTRDLDFEKIEDYRENSEELQQQLTDPNGEGFTPIGNITNLFQGNFDGGKHTLSNIYINNSKDQMHLGLFGYIKNSKISNITLTGEIKTTADANAGIIGSSKGESIIRKCINKTKISSTTNDYSLGGIIGQMNSGTLTIQKCENYGNLSGGDNLGGIIGLNNNSDTNLIINDCHNYGTVTNNLGQHTGGILGRDNSASNVITITNTINEGQVTSTKTSGNIYLGGLVGNVKGTLNIENSQNLKNNEETKITLEVSGTVWPYVGGIVGIDDGATVVMNNVTNEQNMEAKNDSPNNTVVGGLLGYVRNKGSIEINNSKNKAGINVTSSNANNNVGGIIGFSYNSNNENRNIIKIKNVENNAEDKIISTNNNNNRVGGIFGECQNATVEIENVKNKQEIEANSNESSSPNVGGIIGYINKSEAIINTSNNMANLTITNNGTGETRAGGIAGYVTGTSNADINNSQNIGNLNLTINGTGATNTGGIIGRVENNGNVNINESESTGSEIFIKKVANNVSNHNVGGIVGLVYNNSIATITKSYNTANVIGGSRFGGMVGFININSKVLIDKCYNTGNMETDFEVSSSAITIGGIMGYNSYGSIAYITNSYNTGNIKSTKDTSTVYISGIIGNIYSNTSLVNTYIANSYNIGNITNTTNTNNINGIFENRINNNTINKGYINNVYNAGILTNSNKYGIGVIGPGEYNISNAYYLEGEGIAGSDKEGIGIPKTESEIKGLTDTLNNNIESISIPTLKEDFPDYELTFSNWKVGSNGYSTLVNE